MPGMYGGGIRKTVKPGPMFGADIREIVRHLEGLSGSLRSGQSFGDFRPELRAWLKEAGAEVEGRFASPPPQWSVTDSSVKRRLVRWNMPHPPGTDVWTPTPVDIAEQKRKANRVGHFTRKRKRRGGKRPTGYRGLRGSASNVVEGKYKETSLIRVAFLSADFGVRSSADGIPYAKALQKRWDFMKLSAGTRNYLADLVGQGLHERLLGNYDYTGRSAPGSRWADEN